MNTAQKQALKAKAHHLNPIILLGAKGLTDAVIEETNQALLTHELIKVKLSGSEKEERPLMIETLCQALHAECIQKIGYIVVLYRKNPEKNKTAHQHRTKK